MTDDTERRLRDALHGANLPAAPESLRVAMQTVTATPTPRNSGGQWLRVVAVAAAVLVLGVVALSTTGLLGRQSAATSPSPASASAVAPTAQASSSPIFDVPAQVEVLTPAQLAAAIDQVRSGASGAHVVVADVSILRGTGGLPGTVECQQPLGSCTPIGTISGTAQAVTIRAEEQRLPPPTTDADLQQPVALRLVPGGPIEFIGHVGMQGDTGQVSAAGLRALTATAADGLIVPVSAWLNATNGFSCGPMSTLPAPFNCRGNPSFLNDEPVAGAIVDNNPSAAPGSSTTPIQVITGSIPDSAVLVQMGAYSQFAVSPEFPDNVLGTPRNGLYLVRMVTIDNAECPKCRGWLLVGRLDAAPPAPSASSQPNAGQRVYSATELEAALAADRASFVGKAVLVDGKVTPGTATNCGTGDGGATCSLGTLDGTSEAVVAKPYTASLLLPDTDYPTNGQMAMIVRESGLEYLGWMGFMSGGDFVASFPELADPQNLARGPETVIVHGWLGTSGPLPCPAVPGSPPPADTPFADCPTTWLGASSTLATDGGMPDDAVRVQYTAYADFAGSGSSTGMLPREGTYLVRLVTDTRSHDANPPRGWQVVARLGP